MQTPTRSACEAGRRCPLIDRVRRGSSRTHPEQFRACSPQERLSSRLVGPVNAPVPGIVVASARLDRLPKLTQRPTEFVSCMKHPMVGEEGQFVEVPGNFPIHRSIDVGIWGQGLRAAGRGARYVVRGIMNGLDVGPVSVTTLSQQRLAQLITMGAPVLKGSDEPRKGRASRAREDGIESESHAPHRPGGTSQRRGNHHNPSEWMTFTDHREDGAFRSPGHRRAGRATPTSRAYGPFLRSRARSVKVRSVDACVFLQR